MLLVSFTALNSFFMVKAYSLKTFKNSIILSQWKSSKLIYINGKLVEVGPEIEKEKLRQEIEGTKIKE